MNAISEPLDELYFTWLYRHIELSGTRKPARTHLKLARILFSTEFVWWVANDDNRVSDGVALRDEFIDEERLYDVDPDWMDLGCSVLEMLIGLSRRLQFYGEHTPEFWFWDMMKNLGLDTLHDRLRFNPGYVEEVIERVIWRLYEPDGSGGLFPLKNPVQDQRDVELWYQMNAYLMERNAA